MQEGAFALIDCLGFKGIWKRTKDPDLVLEKLIKVEESAHRKLEKFKLAVQKLQIELNPKFILLSDTVAISIPYIHSTEDTQQEAYKKGMVIAAACIYVAGFLKAFIEEEPYLTLRGCITYGEHSINQNFMVGPAVDEAAENYEIANGAFVWLHPKVTEIYRKSRELGSNMSKQILERIRLNPVAEEKTQIIKSVATSIDFWNTIPILIENYDMPLKSGMSLNCSIVNPLIMFSGREERENIIQNYLVSFRSDKIEILLKQQNTMKLLEAANNLGGLSDDRISDFSEVVKILGIEKEILSK